MTRKFSDRVSGGDEKFSEAQLTFVRDMVRNPEDAIMRALNTIESNELAAAAEGGQVGTKGGALKFGPFLKNPAIHQELLGHFTDVAREALARLPLMDKLARFRQSSLSLEQFQQVLGESQQMLGALLEEKSKASPAEAERNDALQIVAPDLYKQVCDLLVVKTKMARGFDAPRMGG